MPDREKVIKALNMHFRKTCKNGDCPYATVGDCEGKLLFDALSLLKEQETIVRCKDCIAAHDGELIYEMWCGITGKRIMRDDFCSNGRRKDE